jgi:hypothetical protein
MPPPPAGAVVDPSELRPRRWWYWLAGTLVAGGTAVGMVVTTQAVVGLVRVSDMQAFRPGEEFEVELRPEAPTSIYVRQGDADIVPLVDCTATAPTGATIDLSETDLTTSVLHDGDVWVAEYDVDVSRAGTFAIECRGFASLTDLELGIGPRADPLAAVNRVGGWGLLSAASIGAGVIIGLVVGLRRTAHRRRLVAGRFPYSPR